MTVGAVASEGCVIFGGVCGVRTAGGGKKSGEKGVPPGAKVADGCCWVWGIGATAGVAAPAGS